MDISNWIVLEITMQDSVVSSEDEADYLERLLFKENLIGKTVKNQSGFKLLI